MAARGEVISTNKGDIAVVIGKGEMDLAIGDEFERALANATTSGNQVEVDFRGVAFIDSAILQSLAIYGAKIYNRGERMRVQLAEGGYPQYVLRVVGFDQLLQIESISE